MGSEAINEVITGGVALNNTMRSGDEYPRFSFIGLDIFIKL